MQCISDIYLSFQITTKEEVNSKHGTSIKTEVEPDTFKPNLREPSDLLEADQIEKVQAAVQTCGDAALHMQV